MSDLYEVFSYNPATNMVVLILATEDVCDAIRTAEDGNALKVAHGPRAVSYADLDGGWIENARRVAEALA